MRAKWANLLMKHHVTLQAAGCCRVLMSAGGRWGRRSSSSGRTEPSHLPARPPARLCMLKFVNEARRVTSRRRSGTQDGGGGWWRSFSRSKKTCGDSGGSCRVGVDLQRSLCCFTYNYHPFVPRARARHRRRSLRGTRVAAAPCRVEWEV